MSAEPLASPPAASNTPFQLLDADEEDGASAANIALHVPEQVDLVAASAALPPHAAIVRVSRPVSGLATQPSAFWADTPTHAIGGPLAMRAMRDAVALQLARRGFDGLRHTSLWLVAELAADFLQALGAQLLREGAVAAPGTPATQVVRQMRRHSNLHSLAEWRQAQLTYARVIEPAGAGTALGRGLEARNHPPAPPPVAPLYAAMRGAWNYNMTTSGRQVHTAEGQIDLPSASGAPVPPGASGKELSESLRLSKKQRQHADAWLQASASSVQGAPVLLPTFLGEEGQPHVNDGFVGQVPPPAPKPRGRKGKAA